MADSKDALNPLTNFPQYDTPKQKVYLEDLLGRDQKAASALLATGDAEVLRAFIQLSYQSPDKFALCQPEELVKALQGNTEFFFIAEVVTEADGKKADEEAKKRKFYAYSEITIDKKPYRIYDKKYNYQICSAPRVLDAQPKSEEKKEEQPKAALSQ